MAIRTSFEKFDKHFRKPLHTQISTMAHLQYFTSSSGFEKGGDAVIFGVSDSPLPSTRRRLLTLDKLL